MSSRGIVGVVGGGGYAGVKTCAQRVSNMIRKQRRAGVYICRHFLRTWRPHKHSSLRHLSAIMLINLPGACRKRTFQPHLPNVLCGAATKGSALFSPQQKRTNVWTFELSFVMLMNPNKDNTAVHVCHSPGDMEERRTKLLARSWLVFECVTPTIPCVAT